MVATSSPATTLEMLLIETAKALQLPIYLDAEVRQHYEALARFLGDTGLVQWRTSLYAQGSFRIGTVIRPKGTDEFDLDFVCEIDFGQEVDPEIVFEIVARAIESSPVYGPKSTRMKRCIRIQFANNCHVDIVPAVPESAFGESICIPDRDGETWTWRSTNPKGYVRWFQSLGLYRTYMEKAASIEPLPTPQELTDKNSLQVSVQLLKRSHQHLVLDSALRTPSIVLTTIAGHAIAGFDSLISSMSTLAHVLPNQYAASSTPVHIQHPAHDETISEKWNRPEVYSAFRSYSKDFQQKWGAVISAQGQGIDSVGAALYALFGERPVSTAIKNVAETTRRLNDAGQLRTAAGGQLVSSTVVPGNRPNTFYGR
jgi:hypothetical protein